MLMPWDPDSYWTYDRGWAHACNTPFREYKRNQHEGGIATPLIAHWPQAVQRPGTITHQVGHLVDIMATCLDVAGVDYPTTLDDRPVGPARGVSLRPILVGEEPEPRGELMFTFYGTHNALRMGDWKLVNIDRGPWELYNLKADRTELSNLVDVEPERFEKMRKVWDEQYAGIAGPRRRGKDKAQKKPQKTRSAGKKLR
jgi:arylsulfatase